jgi:uncharacterized protein (TIGR02452 family)
MPHSRPKPSEIAAEAKRLYIPYCERSIPQYTAYSVLYDDSQRIPVSSDRRTSRWPRVTVMNGDPADVALGWYEYNLKNGQDESVAIVNMANEKRAGGDWESGLMAPEECLARRSNLVRALTTPWQQSSASHYPIPQRGGIYTPQVGMYVPDIIRYLALTLSVVFREGAEHYKIYPQVKFLPVISVAPVRRPKLDESGTSYSFDQERELMKDKMRTILRIAAYWRHRKLCLGAFGVGPVFRNPVREVATMWRQLLFEESEFFGCFDDIAFAIETNQQGNKSGSSDFEAFQHTFDPSRIFATNYR